MPALETAAVVRWFNLPILRAVMEQEDVSDVYNTLRQLPFVQARSIGLAVHDSVREMMDENLRIRDSERHAELHERAAIYFEKRLGKVAGSNQGVPGEESIRLKLERLYHRALVNEETGIKLFQEMAEELVRYKMTDQLKALLNDASSYLGIPPELVAEYKNPQKILSYSSELSNKGKKSTKEIKLLFVGQGSVGKTSLVKRLIWADFKPGESKTDGIAIEHWQLASNTDIENQKSQIQLNIWDFGGQEIMHATHQFFLTKRSLYLLVLDTRLTQEENRVEYWLKIIQSFG
ncbi:hypothetical protein JZU68_04335, partial [bacterium]|nr:hypothetical protein [bacterium]